MLYRSGNCKEAVPRLENAASVPRAQLLLGRCYLESGDNSKAVEVLTKYRTSASDDPFAVVLLGQAQERAGSAAAAASLLRQFAAGHPDDLVTHSALGDLLVRMKDGENALKEYQVVLRALPQDPGAHAGLGELALQDQRYADAIVEFDKAKVAAPANLRVLRGIGAAYVRQDNCDQAIAPLRQALDLAPAEFPVAKMLAACLVRAQKWNELLAALRTGTKEEAADEEATAMVTKAFQATKDDAAAEAYYKRVLAEAPGNITARTDYGDLLFGAKRTADARAQYAEVVKLRPDFARIQERLGDLTEGPEARSHFEAAANSKDGTDGARMKLARLCYDANDSACTNKALAGITSPELAPDVKMLRLKVEYRAKNWDTAGQLANEILAVEPKNLPVLLFAGDVAIQQGRPSDAALLFERALVLDPASKETRYQLVRIYSNNPELDRLPRAVDILTEFISKYQQDGAAYLYLGNVYRKLKDTSNATENFKLGFGKITPPIPDELSWAYNAYGLLLMDQQNYQEAYVNLTQAVQLNPKDESSQFNFALACLHLDRKDDLAGARARLETMNSQYLPLLDQAIQTMERKQGGKR